MKKHPKDFPSERVPVGYFASETLIELPAAPALITVPGIADAAAANATVSASMTASALYATAGILFFIFI